MKSIKKAIGNRETTNEKGIVLVVVLLLMATLALLGLAANRNVITDTRISSNHLSSVQAFYAAEGGAEYGYNRLWQELQRLNPNVGVITPPTINGYAFASASYVAPVGSVVTRATTGNFDGLTAFVQKYRVTSKATENRNNAVGKVALEVEDQLIPLFQFGIFYEDDLEMGPGANMVFSGGRIHTNNKLYMTAYSGRTLSIDSKITAADDILNSDKANRVGQTGTVQIKNGAATPAYQVMDIDSNNADWAGQSQTKWNGRVKNDDHGIHKLNMPLAAGGQPLDLLGTSAGSLNAKAGLRIVNGAATDKSGNPVELRYYDSNYRDGAGNLKIDPGGTALLNVNPISTSTSNPTFYDGREQKTMTALEIDMTKLQNSTAARNALSDPPAGGDSGILYVSSSTISNPSVRLVNGATLDSTKLPQGLSIVSGNPVYVKGDYNTSNRPAAIFTDALTVLSGSWDDAHSTGGISERVASNTTVNAAIMAGNKNTSGSNYSGGVENLIRFLESWTGKTMTYSGSLVCMWQSQQAIRTWPGTGSVYNAPTRNWSYGISYNNLPPGTPRVRNIVRLGWRQVTN